MTLDAFTLDQLRMFVAVSDEGTFSAAARRVQRVQSAVSHAMAALERELGVALWDRSTRVPTLTEQGQAVLSAARRVLADVDALRRTVHGLSDGLEPSLALAVDQLFPIQALVAVCRDFAHRFPAIPLGVHTETLSTVLARVHDGTCALGVAVGTLEPSDVAPELVRHHATSVRLVACAAREHPLAHLRGRITADTLREHIQIVLSERGDLRSPDRGVLSPATWRVLDLATKLELIRAGLGWGNLPAHLARADLAKKRLVRLRPEAWDDRGTVVPMVIVHRPELALGPAARWLRDALGSACRREVRGVAPRRVRLKRRAG